MNIELLKSFTILYVEDETTLRNDVYQNLSPFVKEVITAVDGAEGLELYMQNRSKLDLVITDILMPNMSGIEMVDEIRKVDVEIPVIYTTAFNDSDYMKQTIEQSIVGYIIKPIDIEQLFKAIEKASLKIENDRLKSQLLDMNKKLEKIVEHKTAELVLKNQELNKQLHTDGLTSLPNRRSLIKDIEKLESPIILLIDIDSFKSINDLYGESIGNEVLKSCAETIKEFSKKYNYDAYRLGADVFAILKDDNCAHDTCISNVLSLKEAISGNQIKISGYDISLGIDITVGISKEKEDIVAKAHMALTKAKEEKLSYLIYKEEYDTQKEYQNDIKWTTIIKEAIESDNVIGYYQPIVDVNSKVVKYECLMRIVHNNEVFTPFYFLDIAKKIKFYPDLTKIIIDTAFKTIKKNKCHININLSIQDIINKDIIDLIIRKLENETIAHFITFELLESESITDYERVISFINVVKSFGCKIAIDDFGSGYSNFSYLLRFKPDYIKIDGSLVKNIHTDKNSLLITKTINDFAHGLGMKTVAEYVHCKEIFELLIDMGVDEYQGFYFSEPKKDV